MEVLLASEKIRLFPTKEQEYLFWKFSDIARFTYNECLGYKISEYKENNYNCKLQDLIDHIKDLKYTEDYKWIREAPEAVTKQAIKNLMKAYDNFFRSGNKGFPKFKKKSLTRPSFYQRTDKVYMTDSTHIKLTGIKEPVRVREHEMIYSFKNPYISYDGKYWYFSYSYELEGLEKSKSNKVVGIDLGVSKLAVTSDGKEYKNINKTKRVKQLEKRKKRLQRQVSRKYEDNRRGTQYVKTNNIKKLEQKVRLLDRKLKNIRDTYIHTITMDLVRTKPRVIVIEDLNVRGMLKNRHLSKAVQQQCFYKFREYLTYKCKFYGVELIVADRYYPSSKRCSCCGSIKKFLSLSTRTYICDECEMVKDRDRNASDNLRIYGEQLLSN